MYSKVLDHPKWLESAADLGILESLECPTCHNQSVSVWFTHPREDAYRTWYICSVCGFEIRAVDAGPPYFSDDRVDPRLQAYDANLLATARFPPPPE